MPLPKTPPRPRNAHKGTFGTVMVIGGSATMLGAPCLTATAALRSGCGVVRLSVPVGILPYCLSSEPSATGIPLPDGSGRALADFLKETAHDTVVAVGPGLGATRSRQALLAGLWRGPWPLVIDADALTILAAMIKSLKPRTATTVMTPHPVEARRLVESMALAVDPLDPRQRITSARLLARSTGAVVVLKGQHSVISDGQRYSLNKTGNAALAIPGSGDVLTGVIAALLAQGLSTYDAARLGAHLHGLAGDLWKKKHGGSGLLARELAALLPDAFQRCR